MSEFWQGILIGALLAIPVGIVTNLVTVPIQNALSRRTKQASDQKAVSDAEFEAEAQRYASNRTELWSYLLEVLLRAAFIGALAGVISGFLFIISQTLPIVTITLYQSTGISTGFPVDFLQLGASAIGQLVALIGALLILNIARPAITMVRRVRTITKT